MLIPVMHPYLVIAPLNWSNYLLSIENFSATVL